MTTKVFIDDNGFIKVVYNGEQDLEEAQGLIGAIKSHSEELKSQGKPVRVLVDLSQAGKSSIAARQYAAIEINNVPLDKMAIFGGSPYIRAVVKFILAAMRRSDRFRMFAAEAQAINWLKET